MNQVSELRSLWYAFFKPRGKSALREIAADQGLEFAGYSDPPAKLLPHLDLDWQSELGRSLAGSSKRYQLHNLVRGEHRGRSIAAFDLEQCSTMQDHTDSSIYWSCVLVALDVELPQFSVEHATRVTRALQKTPGLRDVEVGLKDFDDTFSVHAKPAELARELLHEELVHWLMELPLRTSFEIKGDSLLLKRNPLRKRADWEQMIDVAHGFCERIPPSMSSRYPSGAAEAADAPARSERTIEVRAQTMKQSRDALAARSGGLFSRIRNASAGTMTAVKPPEGTPPGAAAEVRRRLLGIYGRGITTGLDSGDVVVVWGAKVEARKRNRRHEFRYRALRLSLDATRGTATGLGFKHDSDAELASDELLSASSDWERGPHSGSEGARVLMWLGDDGYLPSPGGEDHVFSWEALREAVIEAVTGAGWTYRPQVVF